MSIRGSTRFVGSSLGWLAVTASFIGACAPLIVVPDGGDVVGQDAADRADVSTMPPPDATADLVMPPTCPAPQVRCGDVCLYVNSDPNNCGACGRACGANAFCMDGSCVPQCLGGQHLCVPICANDDSPDTCGTRCDPCPGVSNGVATCVAGACGFVCNPGYTYDGVYCAPTVPPLRLVAPLSGTRPCRTRPTMRWMVPPGPSGGHLDIARDAAFTTSVMRFDIGGTSFVPPSPLAAGSWFWRVALFRPGGTEIQSNTWVMYVPTHDRPLDTSCGFVPDFDRDGFGDVSVGSIDTVRMFFGGSGSSPTLGWRLSRTSSFLGHQFGLFIGDAGDMDGDGDGEFVAIETDVGAAPVVRVYPGGDRATPTEVAMVPMQRGDSDTQPLPIRGAGDIDGDGYGDVIIGASNADHFVGAIEEIYGGPRGVGRILRQAGTGTEGFGMSVHGGDFDGDGFSDVLVSAPSGNHAFVYYGGAPGIDPTVSAEIRAAIPGTGGTYGVAVGAGDVNGDGIADAIIGDTGADRVYVYLGSATRTFGSPSATLIGASTSIFGAAVDAIDLDDDGFDDIVVGAVHDMYSGNVFIARSRGDGTFDPLVAFMRPATRPTQLGFSVGSTDFDGDGIGDAMFGAPDDDGNGVVFLLRGQSGSIPLVQSGRIAGESGGDLTGWALGGP